MLFVTLTRHLVATLTPAPAVPALDVRSNMTMHYLLMIILLLPAFCFAEPYVEVEKDEEGRVQLSFYNDTGQELRILAVAEAWTHRTRENFSESANWEVRTSNILVDSMIMAPVKGRKEVVGRVGIPNVLLGIPNKHYDLLKLRIFLEWDTGMVVEWKNPNSRILYIDVTEMIEQGGAGQPATPSEPE